MGERNIMKHLEEFRGNLELKPRCFQLCLIEWESKPDLKTRLFGLKQLIETFFDYHVVFDLLHLIYMH